MATSQPLSLFISSKMKELEAERRTIGAALSKQHMFSWLWEEDAGARPGSIRSTYLKEVEACDIYIGLFWLGYGPSTIEEFEHACAHNKPCLIYEKTVDIDQRDPHLKAFLSRIQRVDHPGGPTVCHFRAPEQLAVQVYRDVMRLLTTTFREGRQQPLAPIKCWLQPPRPTLSKTFVGRQEMLNALITDLEAGESVAVTGKPIARTLQGMGGIGKTYFALKLASELYNHFPGGVIRLDFGPQVASEADAQTLLSRLASYAFGGFSPSGPFYPDQVAAWLGEVAPGRLLVIFDDVWVQAPLRILNLALPVDAVRLVTTRSANVAQALGGKTIQLERLPPLEGLALLEDRLGCQSDTIHRTDLEALVALLGGHALALDIAAARIKRPSRAKLFLDDLRKGIGRGNLESLKLPQNEARDENLEKSLALSYKWMTQEQQRRFRVLGVFAAEAPITVEAAAAVWEASYYLDPAWNTLLNLTDLATVQNALLDLTDLALLTEVEGPAGTIYRQHGLLHAYAHGLLDETGELTRVSLEHAHYYKDMAYQVATTAPLDYSPLDQHIHNLLTAIQWAADHQSTLLSAMQSSLFSTLLEASSQFLQARGQLEILESYLPKALAATRWDIQQANLLMSLGRLENQLGYLNDARADFDAALSLCQEVGNRLGEANVLCDLGYLEHRLGNFDQAYTHYHTALSLYRRECNRLGEANVLARSGDMFLTQKKWAQARDYYVQALPLFVSERDSLGQAHTLIDLGQARFELGDCEQGMHDVKEAAALYRSVQEKEWAGNAEQRLIEMQARR